jgi:hypothetical protein
MMSVNANLEANPGKFKLALIDLSPDAIKNEYKQLELYEFCK